MDRARRRVRIGFLLTFALLAGCYAVIVPPGEAPDEPAHLWYVDTIIRGHRLPPPPAVYDPFNYEFFQPPLDYAVSAVWLRFAHGGALDFPFHPNPAFSFRQPGSRAFLPAEGAAARAARRALVGLRLARLPWGLLAALFLFETALYFLDGDPLRAAMAAAPFALAPQVLFVFATVNCDAAVAALGAIALYCLARAAGQDQPALRFTAGGGAAAALALFAKASGAVLGPPLAFAALCLLRRRRFRPAALLAGSYVLGLLLAAALSLDRFGSLLPPIPAGHPSLRAVLLSPHWIGALWVSFWAKLGWLNLRLPWPLYLGFVPASCLALLGFVRTPPGFEPARRSSLAVMRVAALSNLAFVLAYLIGVDWQAQGRYFFPALGALAALSAAGLRLLPLGPLAASPAAAGWGRGAPPADAGSPATSVAPATLASAAAVALAVALAVLGALRIATAYGQVAKALVSWIGAAVWLTGLK